MYLHENKDLFKEILVRTSEKFGLPEDIIEKDYYVYLLLMKINELCPDAVFKGGTSLSKCYKAINRFSEDIDLTFKSFIKKDKRSKKIKHKTIKATSDFYNIPISNFNLTQGDWEVSHYDFETPSIADYSVSGMNPKVTIETSFLSPCENPEIKEIDCYILQFLRDEKFEIWQQFSLVPLETFKMNVQPMVITFIDKIYALCDYFLDGKFEKHSRHLYDIFKMSFLINIDNDFKNLAKKIREHRITLEKTYSVHQEKSIKQLVEEFSKSNFYKSDYLSKTQKLIAEKNISYEMVIEKINEIVKNDYF